MAILQRTPQPHPLTPVFLILTLTQKIIKASLCYEEELEASHPNGPFSRGFLLLELPLALPHLTDSQNHVTYHDGTLPLRQIHIRDV